MVVIGRTISSLFTASTVARELNSPRTILIRFIVLILFRGHTFNFPGFA